VLRRRVDSKQASKQTSKQASKQARGRVLPEGIDTDSLEFLRRQDHTGKRCVDVATQERPPPVRRPALLLLNWTELDKGLDKELDPGDWVGGWTGVDWTELSG